MGKKIIKAKVKKVVEVEAKEEIKEAVVEITSGNTGYNQPVNNCQCNAGSVE